MLVASEDATAGSVIAKHERMRPSSRGSSHARCCSGVPYLASTCAYAHNCCRLEVTLWAHVIMVPEAQATASDLPYRTVICMTVETPSSWHTDEEGYALACG